jgi:hypothetical protein
MRDITVSPVVTRSHPAAAAAAAAAASAPSSLTIGAAASLIRVLLVPVGGLDGATQTGAKVLRVRRVRLVRHITASPVVTRSHPAAPAPAAAAAVPAVPVPAPAAAPAEVVPRAPPRVLLLRLPRPQCSGIS